MIDVLVMIACGSVLLAGTLIGLPLIFSLLTCLVIVSILALSRGISLSHQKDAAIHSVIKLLQLLLLFALVGVLAGLWRASGTLETLLNLAIPNVSGSGAYAIAFLLCSAMSMLLGTAFGTAATMGSVCMLCAHSLGLNPMLMGGAVLAGSYVGDRTSPFSSSAALVASLTGTNLRDNLASLRRCARLPFMMSVIVFWIMGQHITQAEGIAQTNLQLTSILVAIIPCVVLIASAAAHLPVKITLALSALSAAVIALIAKHYSVIQIADFATFGYQLGQGELAKTLNGGGLISMANVMIITIVGGMYAGVLQASGVLPRMQCYVTKLTSHTGSYPALTICASLASAVAGSQTLAIILTRELCEHSTSRRSMALYLGNTAELLSGLMPWSISCIGVLASAGAPTESVLAACFLYLMPLAALLAAVTLQKDEKAHRLPNLAQRSLLSIVDGEHIRASQQKKAA